MYAALILKGKIIKYTCKLVEFGRLKDTHKTVTGYEWFNKIKQYITGLMN